MVTLLTLWKIYHSFFGKHRQASLASERNRDRETERGLTTLNRSLILGKLTSNPEVSWYLSLASSETLKTTLIRLVYPTAIAHYLCFLGKENSTTTSENIFGHESIFAVYSCTMNTRASNIHHEKKPGRKTNLKSLISPHKTTLLGCQESISDRFTTTSRIIKTTPALHITQPEPRGPLCRA